MAAERESRAFGETKWNYWCLWNLALEGITSFSTVPFRVWSYVGFTISLLAFAYTVYADRSITESYRLELDPGVGPGAASYPGMPP